MKLKQFLTLLLVAISTFINAQTPTLIASGTYKASGSGTSGIPTVSINIPAGKNRVMIISTFSERVHSTFNSNFVYNPDGAKDGDYAHPIFVNGISGAYLSAPWVTNKNTKNNTSTVTFSTNNTVNYVSDAMGLPTGVATITFTGINLPENSGDEMIVNVAVFENANQNPSLLNWNNVEDFNNDSFLTLSGITPAIPVGNTIGNIVFFGTGGISQSKAVTFSSGWTEIQSDVVTNSAGSSSYTLSPNEHDGIGFTTAYRTITSGNPTFTLSRTATNPSTEAASANLIPILPLARPSVSGTVYRDNNGLTGGIDAGGTGGVVWNTANTLWVNAVDTNGNVVATALVNTSGVFIFPSGGNLIEGDVVKFQLSKTQGLVGQPAPAKELPVGWGTVGESTTSGTSDGTINGEFTLTIGTANSPNYTTNRFGVTACAAGATAPFVTTTITNTCPVTTVNLNTAHIGTVPAGSSLVWFNNNTHTGTALSGTQITQAGAGTYYAFYFDSIYNCYSPASAVIATINPCFVCPPDPYAAQQTWWLPYRWPSGSAVKIDFQSGSAVLNNPIAGTFGQGNITSYEGNTAVTNPITGALIFVTDGNKVFRGSDGLQATGFVGGNDSAGEAAGVIPDANGVLGRDFIIFGNASGNTAGPLRSAKYNAETNVLSGITTLLSGSAIYEALEVIPHTNGVDYWILVNTTDQKVKSYLYTKASGFNSTPVSSTDVANLSGVDPTYIAISSFISWDPRNSGKLLIARHNKIGLANFNPSTGALGTWDVKVTQNTGIVKSDEMTGYSAALSPNGRYIYYVPSLSGTIRYHDTTTGNDYSIGTIDSQGAGLKVAKDGRLYIVGYDSGLYYFTTPDTPPTNNPTALLPVFYTGGRGVSLQLPNNVYWGCITCQSGTAAPALASTNITSNPATVGDLIALLSASNQPAGTVITIHSDAIATDANRLSNSTAIVAGTTYYVSFYDGLAICYSPTIEINPFPVCYNDPIIENGFKNETNTGITLLKRSGEWPMVRNSGGIALESNSLGFVPTRMTTVQLETIKSTGNAIEGMMSYDIDAKCMKIYDGTSWKCFNTPSCP